MIATDEDALICDLAETYGIYDYRSLPARTVATLAAGLRENSRIKLKLIDYPLSFETAIQLRIYDLLNWIAWTKTKDASHGRGMPKPLFEKLMRKKDEKEEIGFSSGEEFERERQRLIKEMR